LDVIPLIGDIESIAHYRGRIARKTTPTVKKAIKRMFNHKSGRSQEKSTNAYRNLIFL